MAKAVNTGAASGGGIYRADVTVRNCTVWDNTSADANKNIRGDDSNYVTCNCTTNPVCTGTGNISDAPLFFNAAASNYTLQASSYVGQGPGRASRRGCRVSVLGAHT